MLRRGSLVPNRMRRLTSWGKPLFFFLCTCHIILAFTFVSNDTFGIVVTSPRSATAGSATLLINFSHVCMRRARGMESRRLATRSSLFLRICLEHYIVRLSFFFVRGGHVVSVCRPCVFFRRCFPLLWCGMVWQSDAGDVVDGL